MLRNEINELQKVSEGIFKELKLVKDNCVDKDAMAKHIDDTVKEENWKPIMKASAEQCHKEITAKKDDIVKEMEAAPFNIKKEQCNVIYVG